MTIAAILDRLIPSRVLRRAQADAHNQAQMTTLADSFDAAAERERSMPSVIECNAVACRVTTPHECRWLSHQKWERNKRRRNRAL